MEIKKRKTSLPFVFIKYMCIFGINTVIILGGVFLLFNIMINAGLILPANYSQTRLDENAARIQKASNVEDLIPEGCSYGIYKNDGEYKTGTFSEKRQKQAWKAYEDNNIYAGRSYFRFIRQDNGNVCIVNYYLVSEFAVPGLREKMINPELMAVLLFFALFAAQSVFLARHFGNYLVKRLKVLYDTTKKIKEKDLDFEEKHSDIKEIDEALGSLYQMRTELKYSLEQQWNLEHEKKEQVAALAHDIKTPLTIIRGNAELVNESDDPQEMKEYNEYILQSVEEIERYNRLLQEMILSDKEYKRDTEIISCETLADKFIQQASLLSGRRKLDVVIRRNKMEAELEGNYEQLIRAWNNVVSNAVEYSPSGGKLIVSLSMKEGYMEASVSDEGCGFTEEDLRHAKEQFYQGDRSRHSKEHKGMGLYIAQAFARQQGGRLQIRNAKTTKGAEVILHILTK